MQDEVNLPSVVAEVTAAFAAYNAALDAGDRAALNGFFWNAPHTVRFGVAENLFGHDEISAFRSGQWKAGGGSRHLERVAVTTLGQSFASTNAVFSRSGLPPFFPPKPDMGPAAGRLENYCSACKHNA